MPEISAESKAEIIPDNIDTAESDRQYLAEKNLAYVRDIENRIEELTRERDAFLAATGANDNISSENSLKATQNTEQIPTHNNRAAALFYGLDANRGAVMHADEELNKNQPKQS